MPEPIIDAHHHVWRLDHTPWLQGPTVPRIFGAYDAIRRDYPMEEYRADAAPCGVVQSVYIQVNVAPGAEVAEAAWVQSLAGGPQAISAYANLASLDLAATLDALQAAGNVRAIRQQLHWHKNPQYRFAARPDLFDDADWRRGLALLAPRGLLFELQVFPGQMPGAARLLRAFSETTFILQHAGMLEDRSAAGWAAWRAGMAQLAAAPNCLTKLSGLGTFLHACDVAVWRPVVEPTVALFGPGRCMFGSNFPIEKLWTSYARLIEVVQDSLSGFDAPARRAILHDTAARTYGLPAAP